MGANRCLDWDLTYFTKCWVELGTLYGSFFENCAALTLTHYVILLIVRLGVSPGRLLAAQLRVKITEQISNSLKSFWLVIIFAHFPLLPGSKELGLNFHQPRLSRSLSSLNKLVYSQDRPWVLKFQTICWARSLKFIIVQIKRWATPVTFPLQKVYLLGLYSTTIIPIFRNYGVRTFLSEFLHF